MKNILITGGAGFIGSHLVKHLVEQYPEYNIIVLDSLTYAGNLENLKDIEQYRDNLDSGNYWTFINDDIRDINRITEIVKTLKIDTIIHLAAESHVDRSISNPMEFIQTNVVGTVNLLEAARVVWNETGLDDKLFYHISTDEVYGSLGNTGYFTEKTPYDPQSPYSASKASSDHFVRAYHNTYEIPILVSNCSNNYGPNQFPEKLIPLCIHNIKNNKPLPIYGDGKNVRDWLYVTDHIMAITRILHEGNIGETYNIGGLNEWTNIDLVRKICDVMDFKLDRKLGSSRSLITFVEDRAGHDARYAIDSSKLLTQLQWEPHYNFETGIELTIDWYLNNEDWLDNVTSGEYLTYYEKQYQ